MSCNVVLQDISVSGQQMLLRNSRYVGGSRIELVFSAALRYNTARLTPNPSVVGDPVYGVNLASQEGRLGRPNPAANPIGVHQERSVVLRRAKRLALFLLPLGSERPI
jgi:hypothetical protein